jgi:hypothetical protein
MRRFCAVLMFVLCFCQFVHADDSKLSGTKSVMVKPKPAVKFDGTTLEFAWEGTNPGEVIKEYIPHGETLEAWTKLASTRTYKDLNDPQAMVDAMVKNLESDYPDCPHTVIVNPKTGDLVIDFVLWPQDGSFVEFNVFKYQKLAKGGVVAQQYAVRDYNDPEKFLKDLKPLRERLVAKMASTGLQSGK